MKTMLRIFCLASLAFLLAMPATSFAQSAVMYGSSRNPKMNSKNPAFFPSRSRIYLSLPEINLNLNSPVSVNSIAHYDSIQGKTIINANQLLDTLASDKFRLGLNIPAVGLGLNFDNMFFTFSTEAKINFGLGIPQGIVTFLNEGNYYYTGDNVLELINGDFINATAYLESAIGAGYRITDNLTVGFRVKGLMGILDLSNAGSSLALRTAEDYSTLTASLDLDMNFSAPDCLLEYDADSNISGINFNGINKYSPQNYGFSFDLGARFSTDLFEVSASILDLGPGIKWSESIHKVVSAHENNSFTFDGLNVTEVIQNGNIDTGYTTMLKDTLMSMIDYKVINGGEPYWTSIPTKVNLGGMFHFSDLLSAGLLFHGEFERGLVKVEDVFKSRITGFYSNTSVIARATLADWIELIAAASVIQSKGNWDWFNPGVGVTISLFRTLQTYLFIDYVSTIPLVDAKKVNLTFGLNLLIGRTNNR